MNTEEFTLTAGNQQLRCTLVAPEASLVGDHSGLVAKDEILRFDDSEIAI